MKRARGSTSAAVTRRKEKAGALQKVLGAELYRLAMTWSLAVSGYVKRCVEPAAVLGLSAVVALVLVMIVISGENLDESANLRTWQQDRHAIWEQLSRYPDGEYEEYMTYEEPDFVRENRARRLALIAAREKVIAQSSDDSKQVSKVVPPPEVTPIPELERVETVLVAEKSALAVAKGPDPDDTISDIAAIEVFESRDMAAMDASSLPESPGHAAFVDEQPDTAVADPAAVEALVDDNMRDDSSMMLARADAFDPVALAEGKIETVVPGAGSEQAAAAKERQDEIGRLLSLARESLREYRLLIPKGNNAYEYFRQVETLDPGNREAANGFQKLVGQYAILAEQAIRRGDDRSASNYIRRGLRVDPYDDDLLALQVAMFQPEAGEADPALVPPLQPPRKSTTLFSRLSELIDKDQLGIKENSIWHDEDDELY